MLVTIVIVAVTALVIALSVHYKKTTFLLRFSSTMIIGGSVAVVLNIRDSQLDSEMLNYLVLVIGLGLVCSCMAYWINKKKHS